MSSDSIGQLLRDIGRYPVLPQDEIRRLIAIAQSDRPDALRAKQKVVAHNLKLVVNIAKRYSSYCSSLEFPDLVSEGAKGLMRAVELFDLSRNLQLSTYATNWIRQAITRALYNDDRPIRIPVNRFEKYSQIRRAVQKLRQKLGRKPTLEEIASEAEETVDWVEKHIQLPGSTISLNAKLRGKRGEEDTEFGDLIPIEVESPLDEAIESEKRDQVRAVLSRLKERDRQVLEMRFGLDDGIAKSLEEIGDHLGLSRERIRQIEKRAKQRFKQLAVQSQSFKSAPQTFKPTPQEEVMPRSTAQIRAAIQDALTELMAANKPFTLRDLTLKAKTGTAVLYGREYADLKKQADEAIARLKQGKPATPADSITEHLTKFQATEPPTLTDAITEARDAEILALRQRVQELEQKLHQPQSTVDEKTLILARLEEHIGSIKATLKRIEEQRQQLSEDEKACLLKLNALHELYELETGDRPPVELEMVVTAPTNGNGKHATPGGYLGEIAVGGVA